VIESRVAAKATPVSNAIRFQFFLVDQMFDVRRITNIRIKIKNGIIKNRKILSPI
jgi:hypothetical protein